MSTSTAPMSPAQPRWLTSMTSSVFLLLSSLPMPEVIRDWVMYRSEVDSVLPSTSISQALTSDRYSVTCDLNVAVSLLSPVYREVRSVHSLDKSAFCEDLRKVLPSGCSADQLDSALCAVLDKQAPVCRCRERRAGSSPWYPEICEELRDAKQS